MPEKAQHTPGPWHTSPDCESVRDAKELPVCYTESDYHSIKEQDANASLIAAAPDLLEACETSTEFIGQVLEFLYEQFHDEEMEDDTPDQLLEAFDSAGYGSSKGELYRIVAQLKRTKQANELAIAKAGGQ